MLGIIGGSGIYELDGLKDAHWRTVDTPFGKPSDAILVGELEGKKVAFLPRHGRGHPISPSKLNVRANISALKQLGVTDIISLSAVGSLKETLPPGTFVLVDQYIDLTKRRASTFFEGLVAHVSMAHPVCARLGEVAAKAAAHVPGDFQHGGTYVCIEGPQFSSKAESNIYRSWGADVIGMTGMPEAKLAREADICFSSVAMVTDFDCWHPDHDAVTAAQVAATVGKNAKRARELVRQFIVAFEKHPKACPHGCDQALVNAIMTDPRIHDAVTKQMLSKAGLRIESAPHQESDPHHLAPLIRTVPDFPKKGIQFRDITTLLENGPGFSRTVRALAERYRHQNIDKIMGIDARGFILGGAIAYELGIGFVPVRKKGKLPGATLRVEYALEYGTDAVEIREDGLVQGERVVVVDDLIATGGTAEAAIKLARLKQASVVESCFVIELPALKGRERLQNLGTSVHSLVTFEGD